MRPAPWSMVLVGFVLSVCVVVLMLRVDALSNRVHEHEHEHGVLVCHPIKGDTDGNRVCVTP